MLVEVHQRYGRSILITETGAEGSARPAWLHYVCDEVHQAKWLGVPVEGICIYPIASFTNWDDEHHRQFGLFSAPGVNGKRKTYEPLATELRRQQELLTDEP
jgi:beta-glucosidase/6-phospho-beta-glucosidase/beta-galactosidase